MADNDQTTPTNAGQAQGAAGQQGDFSITVNAQYVKDFSFENPNAPKSLMNAAGGNAPDVNVNLNVEASKLNEDSYESVLKVNADAKIDGETAFIVELSYAAIMTLKNVPDEQIQPVLMIEGPRLLFPFARQVVADATRDGGFPPLLINPIDFVAMYQQNQQKQAQGTA